MLQNHARKIGISVDSLTFDFQVLKYQKGMADKKSRRKSSLVIHDLAYTVSGFLLFGVVSNFCTALRKGVQKAMVVMDLECGELD